VEAFPSLKGGIAGYLVEKTVEEGLDLLASVCVWLFSGRYFLDFADPTISVGKYSVRAP